MSVLFSVTLLMACDAHSEGPDGQPASVFIGEEMGAARSPDGQRHPGEIVNEDRVTGSTSTTAAGEVPQRIGWVKVDDAWVAVVRIVATGTEGQRTISRYAADGRTLDRTVQAPPHPTPGQ